MGKNWEHQQRINEPRNSGARQSRALFLGFKEVSHAQNRFLSNSADGSRIKTDFLVFILLHCIIEGKTNKDNPAC
jgi:hypothetical protein